jgi:hypothetical protein
VHADGWIHTAKLGFFRGLRFAPFRGRVSSLQPPVTRAVSRTRVFLFSARANALSSRSCNADLARELELPEMKFFVVLSFSGGDGRIVLFFPLGSLAFQ